MNNISFNQQQMQVRNLQTVFDGVTSGMAAWIPSKSKYFEKEDGNVLFSNYDMLISSMRENGISNLEFVIYFIISETQNGRTIQTILPITNFCKLEDYSNDVWGGLINDPFNPALKLNIKIRETHWDTVTNIGYVTTNLINEKVLGNKIPEEGKFSKILEYLKDICGEMTTYPYYGIYSYIDEDYTTDYSLKLVGSSAKIHFMTINKMIDWNENRKSRNIRVMPFDKNINKYGAIYMFATVDISEYESIKKRLYTTIELISEKLNEWYPNLDLKIQDTEFKGYINLEREVESYERNK